MENPIAVETPQRRWPLFLLGVIVFVLGPLIYAAQLFMHYLSTPWYLPILATLGVVLMAASTVQRRGIARIIGLVVFMLLCAFETTFILVLTKTPTYAGPAQPGQKPREFEAIFAEGKVFTNADLSNADGRRTVLLFYRGHW